MRANPRTAVAAEISDLRVQFVDLMQELILQKDPQAKSQILTEIQRLMIQSGQLIDDSLAESRRVILALDELISDLGNQNRRLGAKQ